MPNPTTNVFIFYINPNRKLEAFDPFSILTYVEIYVEGVKFHSSNMKIAYRYPWLTMCHNIL